MFFTVYVVGVLLTIVSLMKALDPLEYEEAINEYIDKLQTIDPTRLAYYKDLSKLEKNNIGTNEP